MITVFNYKLRSNDVAWKVYRHEPEIPSLMKPEKQDFLSMHLINWSLVSLNLSNCRDSARRGVFNHLFNNFVSSLQLYFYKENLQKKAY